MLLFLQPNTPSWLLLAVAVLSGGGLGATIVGLVTLLAHRNKTRSEIHRTESEAELNVSEAALRRAEARSLDITDHINIGKVVGDLIVKAGKLEGRVTELVEENLELQTQLSERDMRIAALEMDVESYEKQRMEVTALKLLTESSTGTHGTE